MVVVVRRLQLPLPQVRWLEQHNPNLSQINRKLQPTPTGSMAGTMGVLNSFVQTSFTFDVHYCLRRHTILRTYEDCYKLYGEFEKEFLVMPEFPELTLLAAFDPSLGKFLGEGLAAFLNRIHRMVSNKGMFSPTLMFFLDIPFEKVQTEEEGRIVQILDTPLKPARTVAHIINETWLKNWRSFVMGRGARRYKPPGASILNIKILFCIYFSYSFAEYAHKYTHTYINFRPNQQRKPACEV
jgi:hypothetical protein